MNRGGARGGGEKGKGKAVAEDQTPPPEPENRPLQEIPLELGNLESTYPEMMEIIEAAIKKMLEDEIGMPPTVKGRLYTPAPENGAFLLRMIPDPSEGGKVIIFLIRWRDLYIIAIYVEAVWYHYKDVATEILEMLPPKSQLQYNRIIKLPINSSYDDIGGFNIKVGKPSLTQCIRALGKLGELYSSQHGLKVLRSGPLSLPTIVISEAIRFQLWREWVIEHIDGQVDVAVPAEHNTLFNHWKDISMALATNSAWSGRGVAELLSIARVLMRTFTSNLNWQRGRVQPQRKGDCQLWIPLSKPKDKPVVDLVISEPCQLYRSTSEPLASTTIILFSYQLFVYHSVRLNSIHLMCDICAVIL